MRVSGLRVGSCAVLRGELAVAEGTDEDGIADRRFFGEGYPGVIDPGFEVGMRSTLKFHQAARKGVHTGCDGQIVGEIVIPVGGVVE